MRIFYIFAYQIRRFSPIIMNRKILLLSLITLLLYSFSKGEELNTGLKFNAHTHLAEKRTSLVLDNGQGLACKQDLTLSFDMLVRKENSYFGFIFRIITDTNQNVDLIFSLDKQYKPFPELIVGDNTYPITQSVKTEEWFPIEMSFSRQKKRIALSYENSSIEVPFQFDGIKEVYISFGKCTYGKFASNDVAPVNIKNVRVKEGEDDIRYWKLDKHQGDICYDLISGKEAVAENPHWEIDEHCTWEKVTTIPIDNNAQLAFDQKNAILYIVPDTSKVIAFNIRAMQKTEMKVKSGFPAAGNFSQLVMDTLHNKLISFSLDDEKISHFSFDDLSWSGNDSPTNESVFWHHSSFFSLANDSSIFVFGGYGGYRYNNLLVQIHPFKNEWQKHIVESIYPRYSAATTIVGNDLYIYGGRGSKTGRQELATEYMYDLHKINIETGKTTHIGDFGIDKVTFLPAENMIFNPDDSCFYVLTDYEGGHLVKLSLKDKKASLMGNAMPDKMSSLHLYRNMFYDPAKSKIYAIFDKTPQNSMKSVAVYYMKYPPLMVSDTIQAVVPAHQSYFYWIIVSGLTVLCLIVILFYYRKRRRISKVVPATDQNTYKQQENEKSLDLSKHNICLLGGLSIIDKTGNNITGSFSPTLRNLLLILILYSNTSKKGIISSKLDELLWGDKDENSARNNRNVSIRKLRVLLETIGDISIATNNNYWSISFGKEVFCDYSELMSYLQNPEKLDDENEFVKFLELTSLGALLPNMQLDWLDSFKSELSSVLIDRLLEFSGKDKYRNDTKMQIKIADSIFYNDPLNEEALRLKCLSLFNSGKTGLAKNTYDSFCKEYKMLLNVPYHISFNNLIEQ